MAKKYAYNKDVDEAKTARAVLRFAVQSEEWMWKKLKITLMMLLR